MKPQGVDIGRVLGGTKIPIRAAFVISKAINAAIECGDITRSNRWQLIEYLAADYLAGK